MTIEKAGTRKLHADRCELGEGPSYDRMENTAWWFDIVDRKLFEHCLTSGDTHVHALPSMASMIARIDGEHQLVAMENGLYLRARSDGELALLAPLEADDSATRSNDGRVHPSGALWIGTMGKKAERKAGAIYWFDGGTVRRLYRDITIPNAICYSPDGCTAYFADTAADTVWQVAVDPATALPQGEPSPFLSASDLPLGGQFDGSVIDADGVMWNAAWGGGSVSGYSPDGHLVRTYEVPAVQTTCPAFVGRDLACLLVTTAREGQDERARAADPGAGFTYVIDGSFKGLAEPVFRLAPEAEETGGVTARETAAES